MDRRLGYIFYSALVAILLYLIIYVFIIQQNYLDKEKANGKVFVSLLGRAISYENETFV
jgi:hypothetical protein